MKKVHERLPDWLKRKTSPRVVWPVMVGLTGLILWVGINYRQNQEKFEFVFDITSEQAEPRDNTWFSNQDHEGLVGWMESEFERYDAYLDEFGGPDGISKKADRSFRAPPNGFSRLYTSSFHMADYNAQYMPRNVEYFLQMVMGEQTDFTPDRLTLFNAMTRSDHPMIRAHGLWFLKDKEIWERYTPEDRSQMYTGPVMAKYRAYAYEQALNGEKRLLGFAADATRGDPHQRKVMEVIFMYHRSFGDRNHQVDGFIDDQIFAMTNWLEKEFESLESDHRALVHHVLDRQLLTRSYYQPHPLVPRVFELAGRGSEIPAYRERLELVELIHQLACVESGIMQFKDFRNYDRIHLVDDFLDRSLKSGDFEGYNVHSMRQLFRSRGKEKQFNRLYPPDN